MSTRNGKREESRKTTIGSCGTLECGCTPVRTCYINSKEEFHRYDSPAIIGRDGKKEYCQHGKLHNFMGPAITAKAKKETRWFVKGEEFTCEEFEAIASHKFNEMKGWY